jgi:D-alanyl-D-alanine carboxypeptidase
VPITLSVSDPNLYRKLLLTPTPGRTGWARVPGAKWSGTAFTAVLLPSTTTTVLGVDDTQVLQGIASWYRSKYPTGTASNDFPMGTKLKVTNLDNGKAILVTVVSTGPFVRGRVVDLSYTAFLKIATGGLARVEVERAVAPVVALSVLTDSAPDTDAPGTPVLKATAAARPSVTAPAAYVVDQGSSVELYAKGADTVRPVASLAKLVAAAVFLDTSPDLNKVVAFASADKADCSCLRIVPGETARLKDFLSTALVGSANNATKTLARSSGLDFTTFVTRMNTVAASWGAKTAHFHEPTGLDPANVASARDIARILEGAFRDHPIIRDLLLKQSYTFQTVSSGVLHTIKTTNPLLASSSLRLTGGKTGYLDESLYTFVLRARDSSGHQVIVVILGAATSSARFREAEQLLSWALNNHSWSG